MNPTVNLEMLEEARNHPATAAVAAGSSMSAAIAQCQGSPHEITHTRLQTLINLRREVDGDGWLAGNRAFLTRSAKLRAKSLQRAATPHAYPIYSRVPGGAFNGSNQREMEAIGEYATDMFIKQVADKPAPFAMQVRGHSMTNPTAEVQFPDGTLALCDPGQMPDLGDFVVVVDTTDETLTLKRLVNRAAPPERELWLEPLNPAPDYAAVRYNDEHHQVVGVVVDAMLPVFREPSKTGRRSGW